MSWEEVQRYGEVLIEADPVTHRVRYSMTADNASELARILDRASRSTDGLRVVDKGWKDDSMTLLDAVELATTGRIE